MDVDPRQVPAELKAPAMDAGQPPEPKRGGTFFYCPWTERAPGQVSVCGGVQHGYVGTRFRSPKKYRRHWRQAHA